MKIITIELIKKNTRNKIIIQDLPYEFYCSLHTALDVQLSERSEIGNKYNLNKKSLERTSQSNADFIETIIITTPSGCIVKRLDT